MDVESLTRHFIHHQPTNQTFPEQLDKEVAVVGTLTLEKDMYVEKEYQASK